MAKKLDLNDPGATAFTQALIDATKAQKATADRFNVAADRIATFAASRATQNHAAHAASRDPGAAMFTQALAEVVKAGQQRPNFPGLGPEQGGRSLPGQYTTERNKATAGHDPGSVAFTQALIDAVNADKAAAIELKRAVQGMSQTGYQQRMPGFGYPMMHPWAGGWHPPQPAAPPQPPLIEKRTGPTPAKQFAAAQADLWDKAGTVSKLGFHGTSSTAGRLGQLAGGLNDLGAAKAGTVLSKAAIPLAVAKTGIDAAATFANLSHDRYSTNAQLGRQLMKSNMVGRELLGLHDQLTGRDLEMEQARLKGMEHGAGVQERLGLSGFQAGYNPQQSGREAYARAYQGQSAPVGPVIDRSTAGGEREYLNQQRMLAYRKETLQAEREMKRATGERLGAENELNRLERRNLELQQESARVKREVDKGGAGPDYQVLVERQKNIIDEIQGNTSQRQSAQERAAAARQQESGAAGDYQKAKLREEKLSQADILDSAAQRAGGTAKRLGEMNPYERAYAKQAFENLQQYGPQSLTPEMRSRAQSYAPKEYEKVVEQYGAKTEEYKAGQAKGLDDFGGRGADGKPITGTPGEIQRRADERRKEAGEGEFKIDQDSARKIADQGKALGGEIARIMEDFKKAVIDEIYRAVRSGRNQ